MIFKVEKRRFRKNGELRLTRHYFLRYRFGEMPVDRWKSLGVADKQVAEKKALEFRQEKEREAAGILEPKALRTAATTPLTTHLEDYLADLQKRNRAGRNGRGARQLRMRVTTLLNECKWKVAYNISIDSFLAWRRHQEKSARTLNHYLQAMVSFLNWLERTGRIKGNSLKFVGKVDERGKLTRTRRVLTDEEVRRLVAGSDWRGLERTSANTQLINENPLNVFLQLWINAVCKNRQIPELLIGLNIPRFNVCAATVVIRGYIADTVVDHRLDF